MKCYIAMLLVVVIILTGCTSAKLTSSKNDYMNISAQEAKKIMDTQEGYLILDVRTQKEYDEGHIPGAVLIPDDEIRERAHKQLPDKDQLILVYCRSGRRSKLAAEALVEMGYTNIWEFGGILDWPYETE